jgi:hypothetical protein
MAALPPALRRAMLAAHIICSVGWIGAAAAYFAIGAAAEMNLQPQIVRAAWIGMEVSDWLVIVPLGCLALLEARQKIEPALGVCAGARLAHARPGRSRE